MIKFEEHDNQLFRMLEEPVPLTPDAEMPCLVRLIQDDSRMGMYNRDTKPNRLSDFYLAARIVNNNIIVDEFMESDYHRFEIIGYPVAEGSKEWALYQMMQGEKVVSIIGTVYWKDKTDNHFVKYADSYGHTWVQGIGYWLEFIHDEIGWQLYKEPEPPREPEYIICKRCGGTGYEIKPEPAKEPIADCENCKPACTKSNIDHCQMYEPKPKYKVGDWVECNGNQCLIEVIGRDLGRGNYYHFAHGFGGAYANSIIRKLSHSEIIVKIGCLEGRVEDLSYAENGRFWLIGKATERFPIGMYAILYDEMLDTKTRELVESLLKAQIKENAQEKEK